MGRVMDPFVPIGDLKLSHVHLLLDAVSFTIDAGMARANAVEFEYVRSYLETSALLAERRLQMMTG
jgi:hypothetical protein